MINRLQDHPAGEPFTAGRLSKKPAPILEECYEKPQLEKEVMDLAAVVQVDFAHLIMLAKQGLISEADAGSIILELEDLTLAGPEQFVSQPGYGSINLQIEKQIADRLGQHASGQLPIARSRIDHGATVRRFADRSKILTVLDHVTLLQEVLVQQAECYRSVPSFVYTHFQQAQPATFGHYLLAFASRLDDCFEQLAQVYERLDRCPLGTAGLAGTEVPIDRDLTARLLGFPRIVRNSRTGRDAYYQIEAVSALALIMTILNDLCSDLHVQSSNEFGIIETDDSMCSSSSIFPQKKNPVALEAVKNNAASSFGWVATALASFRNEGTGDQSSRYLEFMGEATTITRNSLRLTSEIIKTVIVNENRTCDLLSRAWVTTNRLGNTLLLKHKLDYRTAHGLVARLVKSCINAGIPPKEVTVKMLQDSAAEMLIRDLPVEEEDLRCALDYRDFLNNCSSVGGVGRDQFQSLWDEEQENVEDNRTWLRASEGRLADASAEMQACSKRLKATVPAGTKKIGDTGI